MIKIILVSLILSGNAFAQTKTKVTVKPAPNPFSTPVPASPAPISPVVNAPVGTSVAATPVAVPEAPKSPWSFVYYTEYQGPALNNFDVRLTQTPGNPPEYAGWYQQFKIGYKVAKSVSMGVALRGNISLDPDAGFSFLDTRFYTQWANYIDTSDVEVTGKVSLELPTTDGSRNKGKLFAVKIDNNFTLKTSLRNWSFSAELELKPTFYNDPVNGGSGRTDLGVSIAPYITVDLVPNVQLLFEGWYHAQHNYVANFYDFQAGDADYLDIGPLITINSHITVNPALRFFMDDISPAKAAIFFNLVAVF